MKIRKLKVRPRKAAYVNPCIVQLTAMLGCWASAKKEANAECAEAAKALHDCVRASGGKAGKAPKSTINYHLARLGKQL